MNTSSKDKADPRLNGTIGYGKNRLDGGHDHRTNRGNDRTPAQKQGDEQRRKS